MKRSAVLGARHRARTIVLLSLATALLPRCSTDLNVGDLIARAGPDDAAVGPAFDASIETGGGGRNDETSTPDAPGSDEPTIDVATPTPDVGRDVGIVADDRSVVPDAPADVSVRDAPSDVAARDVVADARPCLVSASSCARGDDCCSGFCLGTVCTTPAVCQSSGTTCAKSGSCCSGRCDPIGPAASLVCRPSCSADGQPCAKPQDCCSLACTNGTCGGTMCKPKDGSCTTALDCCSMICDTSKNQCDRNDDDGKCRPPGEECDDSDPNECCFGCSGARCANDPAMCRRLGAACTMNAQCCQGLCSTATGRCQIPCLADNAACTMGAECCGFACTGSPGKCGSPAGRTCTATGSSCQTNDQCCSRYCSGGVCDLLCQLTGVRCRVDADCCSGSCAAGLCQKAPPP